MRSYREEGRRDMMRIRARMPGVRLGMIGAAAVATGNLAASTIAIRPDSLRYAAKHQIEDR